MSTSPLLPCKDPPLLHRLALRASSSPLHRPMDEDPRPLGQHGGGDQRGVHLGGPAVPPRLAGSSHLASVHRAPSVSPRPSPRPGSTPPVPARPDRRTLSPSSRPPAPHLDRDVGMNLSPRPTTMRRFNEYVDAPVVTASLQRLHTSSSHTSHHPQQPHTHPHLHPHHPANSDREEIRLFPDSDHHHRGSSNINNNGSRGGSGGGPITSQPTSNKGLLSKPVKDHSPAPPPHKQGGSGGHTDPNAPAALRALANDDEHDSIICKRCGKCKCQDCTSPRALPSRWVCEERYECSAEQLVEICSCLRCVKCVFYHCENSEDNMSTADVPCACCERPHCCKRWTCMGLMSLCVPCLCLYWPLRGLVGLATACYNGCSRRGCQCHRDNSSGQTLTKRPLIDSESSSA